MFAIYTIVFRELLEIILIINLVFAATKNLKNNIRYIIKGSVLGMVAAGVISYYSSSIDELASGMGQELLNGVTLALTSIMIGSALIWINRNTKADSNNIKKLAGEISTGVKSTKAIMWLVSLLILREGAELGVYLISIITTNSYSWEQIFISITLGIITALLISLIFHFTTTSYLKKYIFKISNLLLIFVAAGMASQSANYFIAAGVLPEVMSDFWDSSKIISINSEMGKFLKILVGYDDRPNLMSLFFYVVTIAIITYGLKMSNKSKTV